MGVLYVHVLFRPQPRKWYVHVLNFFLKKALTSLAFSGLIITMKGQVQVYRNLHKTLEDGTKVFSVKNDKGIVEDHVTEIAISRPIFRVGPKGNQRVRDEGRKNVHAYIQGKRMRTSLIDDPTTGIHLEEWVKITYDPYQHKSFVIVRDDLTKEGESKAVSEAWLVEVRRDGVWAYLPMLKESGKTVTVEVDRQPF